MPYRHDTPLAVVQIGVIDESLTRILVSLRVPERHISFRHAELLRHLRERIQKLREERVLNGREGRPSLDQRRPLPYRPQFCSLHPSPEIPSAQDARCLGRVSRAKPRFEQVPPELRRHRGEDHMRHVLILDCHHAAQSHHALELIQRAYQLRLGQILGGVGAPDGVERGVWEGEVRHATDGRLHRAWQRPGSDTRFDGGDILGCEIERRDLPSRANLRGDEGQEGAATRVENASAGLKTDGVKHRLVLRAAGLEVNIEPAALRLGAAS